MKLEHIAVWTNDLEKLKDFYCRFFGGAAGPLYFNELKIYSSYFLSFDSGARLELMHRPGLSTPSDKATCTGLAHFAISLGSIGRVNSLTEELRAAGHWIMSEPRWTGDGYYESVVLDPDGNQIELTA